MKRPVSHFSQKKKKCMCSWGCRLLQSCEPWGWSWRRRRTNRLLDGWETRHETNWTFPLQCDDHSSRIWIWKTNFDTFCITLAYFVIVLSTTLVLWYCACCSKINSDVFILTHLHISKSTKTSGKVLFVNKVQKKKSWKVHSLKKVHILLERKTWKYLTIFVE